MILCLVRSLLAFSTVIGSRNINTKDDTTWYSTWALKVVIVLFTTFISFIFVPFNEGICFFLFYSPSRFVARKPLFSTGSSFPVKLLFFFYLLVFGSTSQSLYLSSAPYTFARNSKREYTYFHRFAFISIILRLAYAIESKFFHLPTTLSLVEKGFAAASSFFRGSNVSETGNHQQFSVTNNHQCLIQHFFCKFYIVASIFIKF